MHIGYDAKRFFLNRAGLGKYSRVLITEIWNAFPEIRTTLFTPHIRGSLFSVNDLPEQATLCTNLGLLPDAIWRTRCITGLCRDQRIDLYHGLSHEIPTNWNPKTIPAVMTIHDVLFLDYPNEYKLPDRWLYKSKLTSSITKSSHLVCVSEYTKSRLLSHFSIPEEKITVIPPPVDVSYWSEKKEEDGTLQEIPPSYLLFVGTWGKRKNLQNVISAMNILRWPLPLVIVGNTASAHMIQLQGKPVHFLRNLSDAQMRTLYQNSEALLYPSLAEGFGLPIVEALASGTKVITSGRGAMKEAAAGLATLCEPEEADSIAEAIQRALSSPRSPLPHKKEILLPFDAPEVAKKTVRLYKTLLQ